MIKRMFLMISICFSFGILLKAQSTSQGLEITEGLVVLDEYYLKINAVIKNTTNDRTFRYVKMLIYLYDESGNQIGVDRISVKDNITASDHALIDTGVLPPGCSSPARRVRDVKKIQGKIASYRLEVEGTPMREDVLGAIENPTIKEEPYAWRVSGEFRCAMGECHNPGFVVAAFDANGQVLYSKQYHVSKTTSVRSLKQGEVHRFENRIFMPTDIPMDNVKNVRIYPMFSPFSSYD